MGVLVRCVILGVLVLGCGRSELGVRSVEAAEEVPGGSGRAGGVMSATGGTISLAGGMMSGGAMPITGGAVAACDLPCGQCPGDGELVHEGFVGVGRYADFPTMPASELRRIREIRGSLAVEMRWDDEQALAALGCLERVDGSVDILVVDPERRDLDVLSSLATVTEDFAVRGMPPGEYSTGSPPAEALRSLAGLSSLNAVGHLTVRNLAALESLDGLETLLVTGGVTVSGNPELRDLDGLGGLVVAGDLIVVDNESLPYCELQALSVRVANACDCGPSLPYGRPCSCVEGCKCTGNDNDSPLCE